MPLAPARFRHVVASGSIMGATVAGVLMLPSALRTGEWAPFFGATAAASGWLTLSIAVCSRYLTWRTRTPLPADTQTLEIMTALPRARLVDLLTDALRDTGARRLRADADGVLTIQGVTRPAFISSGERIDITLTPFGTETLVRASSKPRLRTGFLDGGRSWGHVSSVLQAVLDEEDRRRTKPLDA